FLVDGFMMGATDSYIMLSVKAEGDIDRHCVVMSPEGKEIFSLQKYPREWFCGNKYIVIGGKDEWSVYSLDGEVVYSVPVSLHGHATQKGSFCNRVFLFELMEGRGCYQIFDPVRGQPGPLLQFGLGLLGVLQLSDDRILAVDCEGWCIVTMQHDQVAIGAKYRFDSSIILHAATLWHDGHHAFIAIETRWKEGVQKIVSLSLDTGEATQQLNWEGEWFVGSRAGFVNGYNYLQLNRRQLLGNGGFLIWTSEDVLSLDLFREDLSEDLAVHELASPTKGKHGYRICIRDVSVNRAVRSAASELCRLIGESCSGLYNEASGVIDRKFDGRFVIEICSPETPDEFERGYLSKIVEYHRYNGALSPAGGRLKLQDPEVIWYPIT
ncbi:MAG: hypothetical protein ACRCTL_13050, partial [Pseudomonas sp.]